MKNGNPGSAGMGFQEAALERCTLHALPLITATLEATPDDFLTFFFQGRDTATIISNAC